jgi:hypothetical protein
MKRSMSNVKDEALVKAGILKEVRQVTVDAVIDTGASTLIFKDMDLIVNPLKRELVGAHGDVLEALAL